MPEDQDSRNQVELKQRAGQRLGEFYDETIARIVSDENIPLDEWYVLVSKLMSREETTQAFLEVLDYCKDHGDRVFSPSESRVFKRAFVTYAGVDMKVLLLEKLRDSILYVEVVTAHRKAARRTVSSLEDAF